MRKQDKPLTGQQNKLLVAIQVVITAKKVHHECPIEKSYRSKTRETKRLTQVVISTPDTCNFSPEWVEAAFFASLMFANNYSKGS